MAKATKHIVRAIIPDSHGNHADKQAVSAMLADMRKFQIDQVVWLGDHLDCGGLFSSHQRAYTNEMAETFADDVDACNELLDRVQTACPDAQHHYLFGNHENHCERWASRTFLNKTDADRYLEKQGPAALLKLKQRGFKWYLTSETYGGLPTPGVLRLGRVHFSHGWSFGKNATADHLASAGVSIVHGHTHTAQSILSRSMASGAIGAHCPGTLARLQPLYRHGTPTRWTHGWALQIVNLSTQSFLHLHIPIVRGKSMLSDIPGVLSSSRWPRKARR